VNNDPVNYVDPWGLSASDRKGFWGTTKDVAGKIWAAPMTTIGVIGGSILTGTSLLTGKGGGISIENNAITFTTGFNLGGSVTFGNAIIHAGSRTRGIPWDSASSVDRYDGTTKVNLGKHEEAHTYQYQAYGIFTIPAILGSAIKNGGLKEASFHDFMGKSKYEIAADDYAEFGSSPLP
jgi:hypothetical protein